MNLGSAKKRGGAAGGIRPSAAAESRMKVDQVKIGIRGSNGDEIEENGIGKRGNLKIGRAKRKTEAPPSPPPFPPKRSSIPVSGSVDGIRRSPVLVKKGGKEISKSVDGIEMERSPIKVGRLRCEISKGSEELCKEIVEIDPKDAVSVVENQTSIDNESNSLSNDQENCKEFDVCKENVNSNLKITIEEENEDEEFEEDEVEEEFEDEEEEEIEIELKEMNIPEGSLNPLLISQFLPQLKKDRIEIRRRILYLGLRKVVFFVELVAGPRDWIFGFSIICVEED